MSGDWIPNTSEPPRTSPYWTDPVLKRAMDDPKADVYEKRDRVAEAPSGGKMGRWSWYEMVGRFVAVRRLY